VRLALVGDLTDHLDDDVGVRALGVDVGDADFGVLELELLDSVVDGLLHIRQLEFTQAWHGVATYLLANADRNLLLFVSRDKLRALVIVELANMSATCYS
jgi:hypothetical protein